MDHLTTSSLSAMFVEAELIEQSQTSLFNAQHNYLEVVADLARESYTWAESVCGLSRSQLESIVAASNTHGFANINLAVLGVSRFKPQSLEGQTCSLLSIDKLKSNTPAQVSLLFTFKVRQGVLLTAMAEIASSLKSFAPLVLHSHHEALQWLSEIHGNTKYIESINGTKLFKLTVSSDDMFELCSGIETGNQSRLESKLLRAV